MFTCSKCGAEYSKDQIMMEGNFNCACCGCDTFKYRDVVDPFAHVMEFLKEIGLGV